MPRSHSSTSLVTFVATFAISTLAAPLPNPVHVQSEEDPTTAVSSPYQYETPMDSQVIPRGLATDSVSPEVHTIQPEFHNVKDGTHQASTVNAPFVPPRILARSSVDDPSTDNCRIALDMLERDYAGHGLPLTSLVIESSTLFLLAVFVVYFIVSRFKARREHLRLFTPSTTLFQPSTSSRDSIVKTTPLTPPPAPLSKIDEDNCSSSPTHSSRIQPLNLSPPQTPLYPQRGPPPASPSRAIFRSPSCTNVSTAKGGLEKKASFLSLKG